MSPTKGEIREHIGFISDPIGGGVLVGVGVKVCSHYIF